MLKSVLPGLLSMSLVDVDDFNQTWRYSSVVVTRLKQKSFEDRWESQERALRKTSAPWSAVMEMCPVRVKFSQKTVPMSLAVLRSALTEVT